MSLARITPQTPARDVIIGTQSYANVFRSINLRFSTPQIDNGAFSNEQSGGLFASGTTVYTLTCSGIMAQGSAEAAPLLPPPSGVAATATFAGTTTQTNGINGAVTGTCKVVMASVNEEDLSLNWEYQQGGSTPYVFRGNGGYAMTWNSST